MPGPATATESPSATPTATAVGAAAEIDLVPASGAGRDGSYADADQIDAFARDLRRFEAGELDAETWRSRRVALGAYGQRQEGVHMLRVKLPQGVATAEQLRALADVAVLYSRGFGHVTTRQDFQLHFVHPSHLEPAMRRLASAGLTTSGAGGNTVRNVVACPFAGIAPDEPFDVTPYAEAFTRHFLRHPLGDSLPRKFKVAFEGCAEDHAATAIQDLGFRARLSGEGSGARRVFSVTAAGGTSTLCASGEPLVEELPAGEILALGEAVVRVFHARGDRADRKRNRLKFLVRDMGLAPFRTAVMAELERLRAAGPPRLPFDPERPPEESPPGSRGGAAPSGGRAPAWAPGPFRASNVRPQRQPGFCTVTVSPPRGDVTAGQLCGIAALAEAYGDGSARFTSAGHLLLRWVRDLHVGAVHARLAAAGLGQDGAGSAADVGACPGAEVCRLAVTATREPARRVADEVRRALPETARAVPIPVRMSGCPNGCAQHHLAAIGLQGCTRRVDGAAAPHFQVLLGGHTGEGGAVFGRPAGTVPEERVPELVARLAGLYLAGRRDGEGAGAWFAREFERAREAVAAHSRR